MQFLCSTLFLERLHENVTQVIFVNERLGFVDDFVALVTSPPVITHLWWLKFFSGIHRQKI